MKRRKRTGERTDPCGIPLDTPKLADVSLSTTTDINQSDKKLENQVTERSKAIRRKLG